MELDDTRVAILDASGHLLIQGGPGSGKTTIALLKAARILATLESEQRVLFLSFSRAAVRQIGDRVAEHLPRATRDHLEVRTFHAFFLDFVRAHGPLLTGTPAVFLPPDAENQHKADHNGDWEAETECLARRGIYVFDQLAATAATVLERSPALRHLYSDRYPLIIVDEFQDTNVDQWRVIQALAENSTVICLADPDQRIYEGFVKGVDEERLQHAIKTLTPTPFDLTGDNHRSAGNGILDYANAVMRNEPALPPPAIQYVYYSYPYSPEQVTHYAVLQLQNQLSTQLGRQPTIAVLAPSSAFVARISEAIATDQTLNGKTLPAADHELVWDPGLSAAAGYVVASILEWPALPRIEAITATLRSVADFYRVKFAGKPAESTRSTIAATERAITTFATGKTLRTKTGKTIVDAYDAGLQLTGNPVTDWQLARSRLRGSNELTEVFGKARLLRLLHATDSLAWGLNDIWDGAGAYPAAADAVRRILADELVAGRPAEPHPVTLMNMHKSKGKEFDAVVIVEAQHNAKLLDSGWDAKRVVRQRRVLRVAITRARYRVIFVRPRNAFPLVRVDVPRK
ncbi:DEAD/DEAH box helicase [Amycolatopsis sp. MtRt-6]|uniref:DEAD/DEAH box helicase n=1 Tax=Amycolatopsis sp. MtRt-6 TaxID=2792782 RepID=UPI001A9044BF|nr:DEAD/DEAH box helicase [Amycolatopsis sp. MtRt-6]